ncbi:MAG TPA: ParB N-terminal domain-containing protein [Thiobacillaceae bacterium]|nr:ParB N-terminal domain-containing protein [Thiobacillaceae bacterium]
MSGERGRMSGWAMGTPAGDPRQMLRDRLTLPGPEDAAVRLKRGDDLDGARILVPVLQIRPYDRNPRRAINPHFEEIKASIRAVGLLTPFNITRRPGEAHYMVCGGGNTRLTILQQLLREGDSRFEQVELTFKAWHGDAEAIAGHLGENEQRGEMCFWDRAAGIMDVKAALEAQVGAHLSLRQFEAELKRLGLPVALANISLMKFALDRLAPLGQRLTGLDVKRLQPRMNLLKRFAGLWEMDEADFQGRIVDPVLHEHVLSLAPEAGAEAERLMRRWESTLAAHFGIESKGLTLILSAMEKQPGAQRADLETITPHAPRHIEPGKTGPLPLVIDSASRPVDANDPSLRENQGIPSGSLDVSDLRQQLREAAERLARAGGVASWFSPIDKLPLGYYMEAGALPQDEDMDLRRTLWWLLAVASGQMDPDLARSIPESSRWRRVYLREAGMDESAYPILVEDDLLAYITQDGQATLEPWSLLHLLQDEVLAGHCLELARLTVLACSSDAVTYQHLADVIHRRGRA